VNALPEPTNTHSSLPELVSESGSLLTFYPSLSLEYIASGRGREGGPQGAV
jgi:hypothetical protein